MRNLRTGVLGAVLLAMALAATACPQGGDTTTTDGGTVAGQLTLGGPPECPERPFCIIGLRDVYGVEFEEFTPLDVGGPLTVEALLQGEIDVGLLFSTDPVIQEENLVVLEDDEMLQDAENIVPLIRESVLNDEIRETLNAISAALDTEKMTALNGRAIVDNDDIDAIARDFLEEEGFLDGEAGSGKAAIKVGLSGAFPENQILAEMYAQALEHLGYAVERSPEFGQREISQEAFDRGDVDLVPEYLSSLLVFLDREAEASGDPDENVALLDPLVEAKGLVLLEYSPAQDQNVFVVTQETADRYNLQTMSDLAEEAPAE